LSWCLIHNAHLQKILSFWKILDLRITHLKNMFDYYFYLISTMGSWLNLQRLKTFILCYEIECIKRKFPKLTAET
jgi:hypothetical protein